MGRALTRADQSAAGGARAALFRASGQKPGQGGEDFQLSDRGPDPAKAKIIPVPERPFPAALRDPDLHPTMPRRGQRALALWAATLIAVRSIAWRLLRQKGRKTK